MKYVRPFKSIRIVGQWVVIDKKGRQVPLGKLVSIANGSDKFVRVIHQ
jgi:hypothetical protein